MRLLFVPLIAAALVVVPGSPASAAQIRVTSLSALQSAMDKANAGGPHLANDRKVFGDFLGGYGSALAGSRAVLEIDAVH